MIRYKKLKTMLRNWGNLNFTPTCPRSTYDLQVKAMKDYIAVLEARALMEGIDLTSETSDEPVKYENIYDYIAKNMESMHGDFAVSVTDISEKESNMLLATIHPADWDGDTADFYLHADGREEYTTLV